MCGVLKGYTIHTLVYYGKICLYIMEKYVCISWKNMFVYHGKICLYVMEKYVCILWKNMFVYYGKMGLYIMEKYVSTNLFKFLFPCELSKAKTTINHWKYMIYIQCMYDYD